MDLATTGMAAVDLATMEEGEMNSAVALYAFLAIATVAGCGFLSVATWTGTKQAEREAYYKAEMLKRIAELGGETNPALIYLREQEKIAAIKRVSGFKLGGLINIAVGAALLIMLHSLVHAAGVYLVGLIPTLIGLALFGYAHT